MCKAITRYNISTADQLILFFNDFMTSTKKNLQNFDKTPQCRVTFKINYGIKHHLFQDKQFRFLISKYKN